MYAVIKTGGKQYRVMPGDVLKVETLKAEVGASVNFEEVLMISDGDKITVGTPTIASAKVAATVIAHGRAKKVEIIKFRRRKHHQKRTGHRQNYTQVQIQNINGKGSPERVMEPKTADTSATDTSVKAKPKTAAKKAVAKPAAKKTATTKTTEAKKAVAKKTPAKETTAKKPAEKKTETKKAAPKKAAAKKTTKKSASDDLTKIEGIGPKAAEALTAAGIATYADLGKSTIKAVQKVLDESDGKFGAMVPKTWPKQAKLAAADKWDELKKWQDEMDGGIE